MKPKAPKSDADTVKNIEKLFKAGLEAALKDPEKFWDAENKKTASTPVWKPKGKPKGKEESLGAMVDDLRRVLSDDT